MTRLFRFRLFGFLSLETKDPGRLEVAGLVAAAYLTAIFSGGLLLWLGSLLLSAVVSVVSIPALGFLESMAIFGVVYTLVSYLRTSS